ncbi:aldehyde dehydrogenase [Amycolatopsis sp. NPDC005232]|uniref:aldehyde dehydrogenase n=1 Tax=Amycolatopsis sp. NPDC005232 TaxID=3157027 RepID=UPI00339F3E61
MQVHESLYLGGEWRPALDNAAIEVRSPSTEQLIGSVPAAGRADVDDAVAAARRALRSAEWADLNPDRRAALIDRFADELVADLADRARLTSEQNGMPISIALPAEGQLPVGLLRYYAELCRTRPVEERRPRLDGRGSTLVRREPVGVVAAVVPWNFPQTLTMFKLAPALAAGCPVVLKPSPETVLDAFELAAAADRAGIPPGVLNVVPGGADVGEYLVAHPGVDKVAFTGSTTAGREIGEACGRLLRPVTLELGGKSAAIVADDADVAALAQRLAGVSLLNSGQTCYVSTRILAPRRRYDEVVDAVAGVAGSLTVGDPLDRATQIGPMVSSRHRDRVEAYIELGVAEGAKLVAGGGRPETDRGWFVRPTVFAGVDADSRIAREEIFGPVLVVLPYEELDEAVALANDSDYGLGGTVWTSDVEKGIDLARRIESGSVGVNFYSLDPASPFGGYKDSGVGRELGPEGLAAYEQLKSIYLSH